MYLNLGKLRFLYFQPNKVPSSFLRFFLNMINEIRVKLYGIESLVTCKVIIKSIYMPCLSRVF